MVFCVCEFYSFFFENVLFLKDFWGKHLSFFFVNLAQTVLLNGVNP